MKYENRMCDDALYMHLAVISNDIPTDKQGGSDARIALRCIRLQLNEQGALAFSLHTKDAYRGCAHRFCS